MIIQLKDLNPSQQALAEALLVMDRARVQSLINAELEGGDELVTLTDQTLVPVLEAIGNGWEAGGLALSQMYMAGRIVEECLPQKFASPSLEASSARIAITVLEDYHMLGKNMVVSLLRAAGHSVQDWGRTSVEEAVERARAEETELLLISVLMVRAALQVRQLRAALDAAGLSTRIYVGGAPFRFDTNLCAEVGADGFGTNAADALHLVAAFEKARSDG
ncbi:MAG TPA: cobalamin-dependent protein [Methylobacter sp.]|jgi:methanogenic corrinoid protein MtbC1